MVTVHPTELWFFEPDKNDESPSDRNEHTLDWLARCTNWKAIECRRFLNESLAALPKQVGESFLHNARHRWRSAYFELVLGRTLQVLGAYLKIEEANKGGKRPDFIAEFPDGSVIVEAVSPVFNADAGERVKMQKPLLEIIEERLPEGLRYGVWELPEIDLADSKKDFRKAVDSIFSNLPDDISASRYEIDEEITSGNISLTIFPGESKTGRVAIEPPITYFDNSEDRIRKAVNRKRRQVRDSNDPVLLAIDASGMSTDFEDYDMALFGRTFERVDMEGNTLEIGLDASGLFATKRKESPTYAGVLAFLNVGFLKCPNPVLYLHPRFSGDLPNAFDVVECRSYDADSNQIQIRPGTEDVMDKLNFAKKPAT